MMRMTFSAAGLVLALVVPALVASAPVKAEQLNYDKRGRPTYGSGGPNVVVQQGPHTRLYISKRSWLDAGTEVLPGDRKFTDYAYPPGTPFPVGFAERGAFTGGADLTALEFAAHLRPPLTTIRVPATEMGRRAGEFLLAKIVGQPHAPHYPLETSLILRQSTAPPPRGR